ncbi:MAG: hypothetical protein H7Y28_08200 [Rhodoferax sp.]|nr:hypothetical protein [Rhodoferax sp.]
MIRLLCATALAMFLTPAAQAWDQQQNHYRVSVQADKKLAHVQADVWVQGNELALFNVSPTKELKNGQAQFLANLQVRDLQGAAVPLVDKGEGEYQVQGDRRLVLSYDIRLEHDRYEWPAGVEEVSYRTDEGLMATGYALFLVPGEKMPGQTLVEFDLPAEWKAHTPWQAHTKANTFVVDSRRELVNNALFLGEARALQFKAGGMELRMVLGKRYWPQRAMFRDIMERQLQSYQALFAQPPLAKRYLVVINQGDSGDGGAFSGSFSQFLRSDASLATRHLWGRVLAHELLHFWNGLSLVPKTDEEEWFKEGVTDYLTISTLARNGLVDRQFVKGWLENLSRGQTVARMAQGLEGTVRQAAKNKHRNWLLVYGGGSIAALAMDVEIRRATNNRSGLPDVMRAMYTEFAHPGKTYTLEDIVRVTRQATGVDVAPVLERTVSNTQATDLVPVFAHIGLQLESYLLLDHHLLEAADATPAMGQRFSSMFGRASR